MAVDEARVEELVGQLAGFMTGGALCLGMWLGDELGLYRAMSGSGAMSADDIAKAANTNARLTREWLDGQAAAGLVAYDADEDSYALSDEAAMILADDSSPAFMARGMNTLIAMMIDGEKIKDAFQRDGALSWRDHHQCLFKGTEWFFRPGYRAFLPRAGFPPSTASRTSCARGRRSRTSGAVTAHPRS
jgi:hypothetical protein